MPPTLIGISGTNGSGKDTVGKILTSKHSFCFISVTDILRSELKARGLSYARENTRALSSEWRKKCGLGVLVDKAKEIYDATPGKYCGLAMASLRNPGEADSVHAYSGIMLWIDADPKVRYARINEKSRGEHRSINDNISYDQFLADEAAEMHRQPGSDETTLSMSEVKEKCDLFLFNDSNDLGVLTSKLNELLGFTS